MKRIQRHDEEDQSPIVTINIFVQIESYTTKIRPGQARMQEEEKCTQEPKPTPCDTSVQRTETTRIMGETERTETEKKNQGILTKAVAQKGSHQDCQARHQARRFSRRGIMCSGVSDHKVKQSTKRDHKKQADNHKKRLENRRCVNRKR